MTHHRLKTERYAIAGSCSSPRTARGRPLVLALTSEAVIGTVVREVRLLPRPAADDLPVRPSGARGAAAAGRCCAPASSDEGRLLLRPRRGRAARAYELQARRLRALRRPLRAALVTGRVTSGDGALPAPTSHGALDRGDEQDGRRCRPARRQRRGASASPRSRSSCSPALDAPEPSPRRPRQGRGGRGPAARPAPDHGRHCRRRRGLVMPLRGRPPPQRDRARADALAARLPPGQRRGDRRRDGPGGTSARSAPSFGGRRAIAAIAVVCGDRDARPTRRLASGSSPGVPLVHRTRAGDTTAARRGDRDRAGDRGRQHLQARHPLLGAARRHLLRRGRGREPIVMGCLRDRRRRGSSPPRSSSAPTSADRLAKALAPGRSTSSPSRRRGSPSARPPTSSTRSCARPGSRSSTTSARPAPARS